MRAMILAAGRGERLRPLTDRMPKPLVEVAGRPLIEHQLSWLRRAGVDTVVINLHHLAAQIVAALGDGSRFGLQIIYSHEAELLETGGGIVKALPALGDAPFVLINGDIYTDFDLADLPAEPAPGCDAHLLLTPKPGFRAEGDFEAAAGRVTGRGDAYVYCGIAVLRPRLLAGRSECRFSLRDALFAAVERHAVSAQIWRGLWTDIGTLEQLQALRAQAGPPS
ncbi:MAG: nucleotidyltransferase family protein [Pseudomonadales bacterium]